MLEALGQALGKTPSSVTPDAVAQMLSKVQWTQVENWEAFSDAELATRTGLLDVPFDGSVLIATEASFMPKRGAFMVPAPQLEQFIAEHLETYGECFFNGDVVAMDASGQHLWLFHHDGLYALLGGKVGIY